MHREPRRKHIVLQDVVLALQQVELELELALQLELETELESRKTQHLRMALFGGHVDQSEERIDKIRVRPPC